MSGSSLATAAAGLLALAFLGRVLLAYFPPGRPGAHPPASLGTTWAVSHALGLVAVGGSAALAALLGLRLPPWMLVAAAAGLALVRAATLPGAFVPEHEHAPARGWVARALALAAVATLAWPALELARRGASGPEPYSLGSDGRPRAAAPTSAPENVTHGGAIIAAAGPRAGAPLDLAEHDWAHAGMVFLSVARGGLDPDAGRLLPAISLLALGLLVAHGLERARRVAIGRWLVVLLLASLPPVTLLARAGHPGLVVALFAGAGTALAIPWLRRADRRAGYLALVFCAACAAAAGPAWLAGASGMLVLLLATHRNARGPLLWAALVASAVLVLPARPGAPAPSAGVPEAGAVLALLRGAVSDMHRWGPLWIVVLGAALLWASGYSGGRLREEPGRAERPRRELAALFAWLALLLLSAGLSAARGGNPDAVLVAQLVWALPAASLCAGLVFLRGESAPAAS